MAKRNFQLLTYVKTVLVFFLLGFVVPVLVFAHLDFAISPILMGLWAPLLVLAAYLVVKPKVPNKND